MEKKHFFVTLISFLIFETILSFVINALPFMTYFRYGSILVALLLIIGYWKKWRKVSPWFCLLVVLTLGYSLFMTLFTKGTQNGIADQIAIPIAAVACICVGVGLSFQKQTKDNFLYALYGGLILLGVISLFYTLYSFGFFYILKHTDSSLVHDAEMFVGIEFALVDIRYFGYYFCLLSSGCAALWFGHTEKGNLKLVILIGGILGLVGVLTLPYWVGLILAICGLVVSLGICYFPKKKKIRIIIYSLLGAVFLIGICLVIMKRNHIPRVKLFFDILKSCFHYPLGGQPTFEEYGVVNSYNIFMDALAIGGIIPFISLLALFGYTIYLTIQYYRHSDDSRLKKGCIVTFLIQYFIYVNLNYRQSIFIKYTDQIPLFMDPIFCIVLILIGYMFYQQQKKKQIAVENGEN